MLISNQVVPRPKRKRGRPRKVEIYVHRSPSLAESADTIFSLSQTPSLGVLQTKEHRFTAQSSQLNVAAVPSRLRSATQSDGMDLTHSTSPEKRLHSLYYNTLQPSLAELSENHDNQSITVDGRNHYPVSATFGKCSSTDNSQFSVISPTSSSLLKTNMNDLFIGILSPDKHHQEHPSCFSPQ